MRAKKGYSLILSPNSRLQLPQYITLRRIDKATISHEWDMRVNAGSSAALLGRNVLRFILLWRPATRLIGRIALNTCSRAFPPARLHRETMPSDSHARRVSLGLGRDRSGWP